ncbi:dihydrofolate reductase family protein [Parapedobacter lycopersici]|uniref:dihydrofolate reductase family protein n=1 Tax=Parapedobacter lycopersici TaxID=1864939 RepID=UPI00214D14A3|nr:dihydrofolate reductase family protein [Parapedobacter lycopersici]
MRKLILQAFMSVDGFCADRDKTTGFFDGTYNILEKDVDANQGSLIDSIDLILMGTNTYQLFAGFWPTATGEDPKITTAMNSIPKIVFSSSLKEVAWGSHGNISLVADDAITYIRSLKKGSGKNMIMWGSLHLAQSLLQANLFDEIQLVVAPVAIGKGYRLFPERNKLFPLKLTGSKTFSEGTMLHTYEPGS